jgi:hypothetical protein
MNDTDWIVVSFHTAAPETLIEERAADDENPGKGSSGAQLYEGQTAR